jgi:hypothetical protein
VVSPSGIKMYVSSAIRVPHTLPIDSFLFIYPVKYLATSTNGEVIAQTFRRWPLITELRVQSRVTSCEIHGRRCETGAGFFGNLFHFPLLIIIRHYYILTYRLLCATALTRPHIIRFPFFIFEASTPTWHLINCTVRNVKNV